MRLLLHISDSWMLVVRLIISCNRLEEAIHFPSPLCFVFVYEAYHSIASFSLSTIIFYFWKFISCVYL